MEKVFYPTPHIDAKPEDIAKTVLMPGDPLRSKFIADNFLENPVLFNNVRGIQGYTGTYKGKPVSVMASGMGMPSMGIYSHELYNFFGVENIIRIGTCGAMNTNLKLKDIVLAMGACTNSNYANQFHLAGTFAPIADYGLLKLADETAIKLGYRHHVGNVYTSDNFYNQSSPSDLAFAKMNVLAVEMETAALYMNAAAAGKKALALFTIADSVVTGESLPAYDRQNSFTDMMKLALEISNQL